MFRLTRALALSSVLALGVAGCGTDDTGGAATAATTTAVSASTTAAASTTEAVAAETTMAPAPTDPPLTEAIDPPSKIVSMYPTATEMLFAIGAGDQVIAVDDQSNFPAEAAAKQTDLSGYTPNVEAIASYEPDLVLIDGTSPDLQGQLEALDIAVWVGPAALTFDDIYTQIEQLGAATGHLADATALVAQMTSDIAAAIASVPELAEPPSYYHELDPSLYSATSNTFIGNVYGLFGLRNIADTVEGDTDYPQLSAEFVISQSPDLIFLADTKCCGETVESVTAREGWSSVSAVVTGSIVAVDDDIASRWGPRVVDYIKVVAEAVRQVAALSAG